LKFKGQQLNKINLKQNSIFRITEGSACFSANKSVFEHFFTAHLNNTHSRLNNTPIQLSALFSGFLSECGRSFSTLITFGFFAKKTIFLTNLQ